MVARVGKTAAGFVTGGMHVSKRLIFSYVVDWIVIFGTAAVGGGFSKIVGNMHDFNIYDPSISYPQHPDTVSVAVLLVVSVVAPGVIIFVVCMLLISDPTIPAHTSKKLIWRHKLWEWNVGWMGLGLSLAGAFMVTEALKDLYGKPRPDLLARCDPNVSNLREHVVGGLGLGHDGGPVMVSHTICRNQDMSDLQNGFASFPSGHSSLSWAGMLYLSLFLAAKFGVSIPYLAPSPLGFGGHIVSRFQDYHGSTRRRDQDTPTDSKSANMYPPPSVIANRNRRAAPPLPALVAAFIPIGTALYISGSRWNDNKHHGFDIISGSLVGIVFAWFGFRWYHLPIRRGAGWSWGARSKERAFWAGFGAHMWVDPQRWENGRRPEDGRKQETEEQDDMSVDLEVGNGVNNGPGKRQEYEESIENDEVLDGSREDRVGQPRQTQRDGNGDGLEMTSLPETVAASGRRIAEVGDFQ